jgi:predicted methyltransferase
MTLARVVLLALCGGGALGVVLFVIACGSARARDAPPREVHSAHAAGHTHAFASAEQSAAMLDDPARDAWQRPDDVLRAMALAPSMTVAAVGAGTGYFAVRLARAVRQGAVIATDIEPDMVRYLEVRARREQLPNLRAVSASRTASGLAPNSVDAIFVVDVWHHLDDRASYARDLVAALRPGGRLIVVDFTAAAHRGPPAHM